jgi:heme-degrading monooxygenase HmoA
MFMRKVGVRLKPGSLDDFVRVMHAQILPWLREQEGFEDLITLASSDGREVATLTFWDHEGNAQACKADCSEALQKLERLLDGVPYVKTFLVVGSTVAQIAPSEYGKTQATDETAKHAAIGMM